MVPIESFFFFCLSKSMMLEWVRSVAGSSVMLAGCLAVERLLVLVGVTLRAGLSDIGFVTEQKVLEMVLLLV